MELTVVILASREARTLARCLGSIARARPPKDLEVLAVTNGNADPSLPDLIAHYQQTLPSLRLLRIERSSLGCARNIAIREARGRVLCFLDDDIEVPREYFRVLLRKLERFPRVAAIGGPNRTFPESPAFQRLVGHVLESRLGAWKMRRRYAGYAQDTWTDDRGLILCNLSIPRAVLEKEGLLFNEDVDRNEENLLLEQLRRRGYGLLHSPALFVYHERRRDLSSFFHQCLLSGKGRAQITKELPSSLRATYLLPLGLLAGMVGWMIAPRIFMAPLTTYAAAVAATSLVITLREREPWSSLPKLLALFPAAHLGYAVGLIAGFLPRRHSDKQLRRSLWNWTAEPIKS